MHPNTVTLKPLTMAGQSAIIVYSSGMGDYVLLE